MNAHNKASIDSLLRHYRPVMLANSSVKRTMCFDDYSVKSFKPCSTTADKTRTFADGTKTHKTAMQPYVRSKSKILRQHMDLQNRNVLNFKAAAFGNTAKSRIGSTSLVREIDVKVGLFGSQSRLGQAVQGVGSAVTPGNLSTIRSPIRSRLYAAITPGGGNDRRMPRPGGERGYRCPAGFEFGGRFTDSRFSTCGAQLFDIPGMLGRAIAGAARAVPGQDLENISQVIQGGTANDKLYAIQRMANIPRSGAPNPAKRRAAAEAAIRTITGSPAGEARLIRKDGVTLQPLVPSSVLRNFGGNPDMEDGIFVRSIQRPDDIKGDDLALLAGPSVAGVYYVAGNGSVIGIERQRDLTVGERRKFGRQLNRVAGTVDAYDVGSTVRDFASGTNGAFKYTERFPNVEKPLDYVEFTDSSGKKTQVRRWVFETFLKGGKKNRRGVDARTSQNVRQIAEDEADLNESPQTVKEAVAYIDGGGNPFDVRGEMLSDTLNRSKTFESRKLGTGIIVHQNGKGSVVYQSPETVKNGSIAEKIYADIFGALGGVSQTVRLGGKDGSREAFIGESTRRDIRVDSSIPFSKIDKGEIFRAAVTDYLLDTRGRSPATLRPAVAGNGTTVLPSSNELSALAGLTKEEIARRFDLDLPKYLEQDRGSIYKSELTDLSAIQKQIIEKLYASMIERARNFEWDEYTSRLRSDGSLSKAEMLHISIIKNIFLARLARLVKGKNAIFRAFGTS